MPSQTKAAKQAISERSQHIYEVPFRTVDPGRFRQVLDEGLWQELSANFANARSLLRGRTIWHVNSTPAGGGVAEVFRAMLPYCRGAGLDVRWVVISADPEFFVLTKRLHHFLHGSCGDAGPLGVQERRRYDTHLALNAAELTALVRADDIVVLHDPQTAGLLPWIKKRGARTVWRSHIGTDKTNDYVKAAWKFLLSYIDGADAFIFSRKQFVPGSIRQQPVKIIPPSIDPFSVKNQSIPREIVQAILHRVGICHGSVKSNLSPTFKYNDGTLGHVTHLSDIVQSGPSPDFDTPLCVQISRWDSLKDPQGVMCGFAQHVVPNCAAHLVLAGPTVHSVVDDREAAGELDACVRVWRSLSHTQRNRIHLACLPMHNFEENAAIVNALQRHATVIIQKSLQEGFGLTVTEAMWKQRAVVASAVGGIRDQIDTGKNGILLEDPKDLESFGKTLVAMLADSKEALRLGNEAQEKVRQCFLMNRHLNQYLQLFTELSHR